MKHQEMRPEELRVGALYRLVRDVKNPVVDRRSASYLMKHEVFKKGARFVCLPSDMDPRVLRIHVARPGVGGFPSSEGFTASVRAPDGPRLSKLARDQNWTAAVVPALQEEAIDTWEKMRTAYGWHAMPAVLRHLVEDGTVSLERVLELVREETLVTGHGDDQVS